MNDVKAVMCDIDGTLLNSKGVVTSKTIEAIKKLREQGILFGISTGRDVPSVRRLFGKCDTCTLALNDEEYPYIVPLNFGMDVHDGHVDLYFHGAAKGKKLDLIAKDNRATFEMDCEHNFILYEERMSCTMGFASVIGHGTIEIVPDEDKYKALKILMNQYHAEDFKFDTRMMSVTTVLKMTVTDMVGKRRNNIH